MAACMVAAAEEVVMDGHFKTIQLTTLD